LPSGFRRWGSMEQRANLRRWLRRLARPAWLGTLRRTAPLSDAWGYDRGIPVDRHYIERFLESHRNDIHGRVLEVGDRHYCGRFGEGVSACDVLDIDPSNPLATIVADLAQAETIPDDQFDCVILTQVLQFVFDARAAITHAHRILRPGGVLLATVPSVSRIDRALATSDFWRFTRASCTTVFGSAFGPAQVEVRAQGNVLADIAFLTGMAAEELGRRELDICDEFFPLIITVRAAKA
jgi:SAM-dependent methyltransferase